MRIYGNSVQKNERQSSKMYIGTHAYTHAHTHIVKMTFTQLLEDIDQKDESCSCQIFLCYFSSFVTVVIIATSDDEGYNIIECEK